MQFVLSFIGWMIALIVLPMAFPVQTILLKLMANGIFNYQRNQQNIDNSVNAGYRIFLFPVW